MNPRLLKLFAASLELVFAACLWGFGFVAIVWALAAWSPAQLLFLRFAIGGGVGLLISYFFSRPSRAEVYQLFKLSFLPAAFLMWMVYFQTWGLQFTTATKSGFITVLYVVMVPIIDSVSEKRKIPVLVWFCILISLIGVGLIVNIKLDADWSRGDFLTLICALGGSLQILSLDRVTGFISRPFVFNTFQSLWCCLFALILLPLEGPLVFSSHSGWLPWAGVLALALGGTLIAFFLQIKAQKILSPTVSSLFFLLESPFALLFAFLLLGERLQIREGLGAVLIILSACLATTREQRKAQGTLQIPTP
jgi:drug/metabolite transporter (DMT)-like permease